MTLPLTALETIEHLDFEHALQCDSGAVDDLPCPNPAALRVMRLTCPECAAPPVTWLICQPCWSQIRFDGFFTHACSAHIPADYCVYLGPIGMKP